MSILEVNNVSKSFGGVKANVDISMTVEKGKIFGLIGPNGSGKTTLFNSIVGTYPIDSGSIKLNINESPPTPKKSVNFGPGADLLMNQSNQKKMQSPKSDINLDDLNDIENINLAVLDPKKEARFKITRPSPYGERYKLFVIDKNTFEEKYNLEDYGISIIKEKDKIVVDNLKWNGEAKKSGFEMGDYISEFKIENSDRPSKIVVYPIAILSLIIFGYLNYRRK